MDKIGLISTKLGQNSTELKQQNSTKLNSNVQFELSTIEFQLVLIYYLHEGVFWGRVECQYIDNNRTYMLNYSQILRISWYKSHLVAAWPTLNLIILNEINKYFLGIATQFGQKMVKFCNSAILFCHSIIDFSLRNWQMRQY